MSDLRRELDVLTGAAEERALSTLRTEKFEIIGRQRDQREKQKLLRKIASDAHRSDAGVLGMLPSVLALTSHERRAYSISRLISAMGKPEKDPCLETEISAAISSDIGSVPAHGGCWIPFRMSGLDTKTDAAGDYLVPTKVSPNIVDALRAHAAVLRLGATLMSGVRTNFQLPVEDSILAASWAVENPGSDVTQSDPSVQARVLHPHPMQATTAISRQLLQQSSADMNRWLAGRIGKAHAQLLDSAALIGPGTSNAPLGILNAPGIGNVAIGPNGGAVAASHLIALESAVGAANGDVGALSFLTNTVQRGKLRTVPEIAGGTFPVWRDSRVLDYPAFASNQIPSSLTKGSANNCSAILFGNWNNLLVVEFDGAMEVVIDQVTKVRQGMVELTSYAAYDVGLTTPASMAAITDAL